ncbi:hypothetical protein GCM10023340_35840 [Nocardioides marinquilinus]|uniref:HPt domain-containing protein n=1 Tax=Nocardioides marinquilinus TaxID=1210400 RepID=A0ABP9Q162_9ACTN
MSDRTPHTSAVLDGLDRLEGLDVERLDALRDLDPGETGYLDRAIANFQVTSTDAVAAIRAAVAEGDGVVVRARSHKIAGSALNLGCRRAGSVAQGLELAADREDAVRDADLAELDDAMAEARALLLRYRETYAS